MTDSPLYIAGIGVSKANAAVSNATLHQLAISAGAKALLDAGITFDDVNHGIACFLDDNLKIPRSCFDTFGKTGTSVSEVDCASGLFAACQTIKSGYANCALMIGLDKDTPREQSPEAEQRKISAVAVVLVSSLFLASHSFLKDSAARISGSAAVNPIYSRTSSQDSETLATKKAVRAALRHAALAADDIEIVHSQHESNPRLRELLAELSTGKGPEHLTLAGSTGLLGLCELVWQLRGWTRDRSVSGIKTCLQCTAGPDGAVHATILCRADGKSAPKWREVEHLRDGRERVGHNPAIENKDISFEDWLAVKSRDEFVPDATRKQIALPVKGGDRAALARL